MQRYVIRYLLLGILTSNTSVAEENSLAIDVGHSKVSVGAVSAHGKPEFEFNVALAKAINEFICSYNIPIVQIGYDGDITKLGDRTQQANLAGAKLFLSIHHDSVQPQYLKQWQWQGQTRQYTDYASGFSLFVSRKNPQLATSLRCATAIGSALKQKGFHFSPHHSEQTPGEDKEWADKANGVYYYDDLVVLKTAKMPAVLLEAGVIVNREEEQSLQNPGVRNKIASAIAQGLLACKVLMPD